MMCSQSSRVTSTSGISAPLRVGDEGVEATERLAHSATSRSFPRRCGRLGQEDGRRRAPRPRRRAVGPRPRARRRSPHVEAVTRERQRDAAADAAVAGRAGDERDGHELDHHPQLAAVRDAHLVRAQPDVVEGDAAPVGTWNSSECQGQVTTSSSQIHASFQSVCGPKSIVPRRRPRRGPRWCGQRFEDRVHLAADVEDAELAVADAHDPVRAGRKLLQPRSDARSGTSMPKNSAAFSPMMRRRASAPNGSRRRAACDRSRGAASPRRTWPCARRRRARTA